MSDVAYVCPTCLAEFTANFHGSFCPDCGLELVSAESQVRPPLQTSTLLEVAGHRIVADFGLVSGSTVRARNAGARFVAGISQNFGGELSGYTRLLQDAREEAVERMCDEADELGANAVVGISMVTAELFDIAVELVAYGTAVQIEQIE